ncbi:MAG: papain-like cysteine protease family protein [Endozoicomonas sp.]|uniref:papain-like cysteine protease family protein n=1 Tax=Endozoicomonas sp. TaxID=1892382 RepID=UPI003D9B6D07
MTDIYLNVPYVTQKKIGGHIIGGETREDPTGCWYAAVSMLGYYREQGPRLGVPSQYVKLNGQPQKVDNKGNTAALGACRTYH